jgi:hypothetical protein
MNNETFKGMVLGVLQNADEDFARQALLALGHGHCSANAHPHSEQPFSAEEHRQRAEPAGKEIERQRQRAEQAEQDVEWYKRRLDEWREWTENNVEARIEDHKRRADAYAAWLAEHHNTLKDTADAVWTLLFQYGEEDLTDG